MQEPVHSLPSRRRTRSERARRSREIRTCCVPHRWMRHRRGAAGSTPTLAQGYRGGEDSGAKRRSADTRDLCVTATDPQASRSVAALTHRELPRQADYGALASGSRRSNSFLTTA
jgi:hypothetical protein